MINLSLSSLQEP